MDEFQLIDRLIEILGDEARGPPIRLGPGDDAALIELPPGQVGVASIDTMVADVHFPAAAPADLIGFRALGVSVSDLAAMGAEPTFALIALTLPQDAADWIERFAHGISDAASRIGIKVAGGNLARGPLNITVSVHGSVRESEALVRSGAAPGDLVCVSGLLGGAAMALQRSDLVMPPSRGSLLEAASDSADYPLRRYYLPEPCIALGRALRTLASAAIDVSDGLIADLSHICGSSQVGADLDLDAIPACPGVRRNSPPPEAMTTNCASRLRRSGSTVFAACRHRSPSSARFGPVAA